jgi:conjugative transfer signal peptidase TraF
MKRPPLTIALLAAAALSLTALVHRPLLVWNASSSMPRGLYRASLAKPDIGDLVLIEPPSSFMRLALERGYLKGPIPFVKEIAAAAGDTVCRQGRTISLGGVAFAQAMDADAEGRPLPDWEGCRLLKKNEVFVLGGHAGSFDSRYFGPLPRAAIITTLVPLWTRLKYQRNASLSHQQASRFRQAPASAQARL